MKNIIAVAHRPSLIASYCGSRILADTIDDFHVLDSSFNDVHGHRGQSRNETTDHTGTKVNEDAIMEIFCN